MDGEDTASGEIAALDFQAVVEQIADEVRPLTEQGHVADYIPRLAEVPAEQFGMAVATIDGHVHRTGEAEVPFSVQSISKVFTLTQALQTVGTNLWQRVGREPSGNPFNSLVQLEHERGIPRNPMINPGAHVVADVVLSGMSDVADAQRQLLAFARRRSGNPNLAVDEEVARSERQAGFRSTALVNFLRSFDNIDNDVNDVLDFYFHQCALRMNCVDLARSFLYLANGGYCPVSEEAVISTPRAKRINAIMLTCGTYDAAGDFAFQVGLPAKSGVGGGIVAVVPHLMSIAVWSPALDHHGNSLAGGVALARFTELTGLSVF